MRRQTVNQAHCKLECIYLHYLCEVRYITTSRMLRRNPLVVILGSTATGKTKLSIELANRFKGEIISADSMQIYKGLDVSTAKATTEERSRAVHHMLDVCEIKTRTYSVVDFRDNAVPKINQLLDEEKMPIIVGGTTYYIEALLWKVLISSNERDCDASNKSYDKLPVEEILKKLNVKGSYSDDPAILHHVLTQVDPVTAETLHPNNVRKIRRALEVFIETGKPMSAHLKDQQLQQGGSYLGGPMRYPHVILLWLKCDQAKLNERIDRRIDSMINDGMLFEIRDCYNQLKCDGIDPTRGIMQAIGFKEFLPYLEHYSDESFDAEITAFIREHGGLSGQKKFIIKNRISDALKLLEKCLDDLRLETKRYSKKQLKWIRNRMVSTKGRPMPPVYELDGSNAETNWHEDVFSKAENVIQSFLENIEPAVKPAEKAEHPSAHLNMRITHFCHVCNRRFVGDLDFNHHMNSNVHKKTLQSQRKQQSRALANRSSFLKIIHGIWDYCRTRIEPIFRRK